MSDKKGSSSYSTGDCGGSHGDYVHGIGSLTIRNFAAKSKKPKAAPVSQFTKEKATAHTTEIGG